jgi:hypothetical protein
VDLLHFRDSLTPSNETFGSISGSIGSILVGNSSGDFSYFLTKIVAVGIDGTDRC